MILHDFKVSYQVVRCCSLSVCRTAFGARLISHICISFDDESKNLPQLQCFQCLASNRGDELVTVVISIYGFKDVAGPDISELNDVTSVFSSYYASQKKTFEINPRHPLIKDMLRRVKVNK